MLQFFIFPMAIVAVCVTVFVVFGLIASEGKSARDYLGEVRSGGANRRWQAAFELSKVIQGKKDAALEDPRFAPEAIALFEDSANDDPRVRRYLALALGRLGDRAAVPALLEALDEDAADSETVIYSIWALGTIGDPVAVPDLVRFAQSEDRGYRKAAVHALGVFATDEAAQAALREPLSRTPPTTCAGTRPSPSAGAAIPLRRRCCCRCWIAPPSPRTEGVTPEQAEARDAVGDSRRGGPRRPRASSRPSRRLRDKDPSLKVREGSRAAGVLASRPRARTIRAQRTGARRGAAPVGRAS